MAQTLHRILVHVVFSTKDRAPLLKVPIRPRLFAYLGGEPLIVNGVADHVHMLLTLPSTVTLAEAMRRIKAKSSHWLRQETQDFAWQPRLCGFQRKPIQRRPRHKIHSQPGGTSQTNGVQGRISFFVEAARTGIRGAFLVALSGSCRPFRARAGRGRYLGFRRSGSTLGYDPAAASRL